MNKLFVFLLIFSLCVPCLASPWSVSVSHNLLIPEDDDIDQVQQGVEAGVAYQVHKNLDLGLDYFFVPWESNFHSKFNTHTIYFVLSPKVRLTRTIELYGVAGIGQEFYSNLNLTRGEHIDRNFGRAAKFGAGIRKLINHWSIGLECDYRYGFTKGTSSLTTPAWVGQVKAQYRF